MHRRLIPSPLLLSLLAGSGLLLSSSVVPLKAAPDSHLWKGGAGAWDDASHWDGKPFHPEDTASIEGDGQVRFTHGDVTLSVVEVGAYHKANASMTMEGGMLALPHYLRIGEMTGAAGKLIQSGGDIRTVEVFVGAANVGDGADRHAIGELEIRGGSLVTRHLTLGWGLGSTGRIHIVGSAARPVLVLDYFWVGVRNLPSGSSTTEMNYDIDADGVTPIVHWNARSSAISLVDRNLRGTCKLHIGLLHEPPHGDIALLRLRKPCRGIFTDLPEGSPIHAEFGGKTYVWTLSYHGGASKSDVVLTQPRILDVKGEETSYSGGHEVKPFEVTVEEADSGLRELIQRETAGEAPVNQSAQRAFPGAEGFGAFAKGGRGGRALFVTNLDDSGPGSFRAAIEAKGPRTIIFRVGGVITLKSALTIREPLVTVAGQTAPGDGICVRADNSIHADTFVLNRTHDVIVRYLRAESGKGPGEARYDDGGDCISVYDSQDFIIDHCSTHFGTDETLSVTGASDRYTVQWTIIAEGLNYEKHSMASLLGGGRSTWSHNLFAHNGSRNPNLAGEPTCDFRNNVLYDWGHTSGQGSFIQVNYVGNYLRPGPSTVQKPRRFLAGGTTVLRASLHLAGNVIEGSPEVTNDNLRGVDRDAGDLSPTPFPMVPIKHESAEEALELVLDHVGATLPKRDAADARVIRDVREHSGKIIASQEEIGGWPAYTSTVSTVVDSDHDGIPDEWEKQHGLDPNDPTDAQKLAPGGYTWLEQYLNELAGTSDG